MDLLFPILFCFLLALAWWPWSCCPSEQCLACKDGNYPANLSLTIADVGNTPWCLDCENLEGTFVVPFVSCIEVGGGEWIAHYFAGFPDVAICTTMLMNLRVYIWWHADGVAGRRKIQVNFEWAAIPIVIWRLTENGQDDPFDCEVFNLLDIPFVGIGIECAGTPTCLLSAA